MFLGRGQRKCTSLFLVAAFFSRCFVSGCTWIFGRCKVMVVSDCASVTTSYTGKPQPRNRLGMSRWSQTSSSNYGKWAHEELQHTGVSSSCAEHSGDITYLCKCWVALGWAPEGKALVRGRRPTRRFQGLFHVIRANFCCASSRGLICLCFGHRPLMCWTWTPTFIPQWDGSNF